MIIFPSSPLSCCLPRRTPMAPQRKGEIQLLQEKASLDMAPTFLWQPATKSIGAPRDITGNTLLSL
jgi:hypothetical protein